MNENELKVAVIGGGGFLGSHLTQALISDNNVSQLNILDYQQPNPAVSAYQADNVTYHSGINVLDNDYTELLAECDVVYYLVAIMKFGYRNQKDMFHLNGDAVKQNLELAANAGVKHFIFVSSIATVGSDAKGEWKGTEDKSVDFTTKQFAYYGRSKQLGEDHVWQAIKNNLIPKISIACPGIMIGTNDQKMEPLYKLSRRMPLLLSPPGGTNYVDVRDVASGLVAIAKKGKHGGKYLLTNNANNIRHGELLLTMARGYNKSPRIIYFPRFLGPLFWNLIRPFELIQPKSSKGAKEGVYKSFIKRYFDNNLTMEELGWSPSYSLDETIAEVITSGK